MRFGTALSLSLMFTLQSLARVAVGVDRRDPAIVPRVENSTATTVFTNAQLTFYNVGLGACGRENVASDFVASLNVPQYGSNAVSPDCFKTITISFGGKTAQATIVDECPTCPFAGLDLSVGLFEFFAPLSAGLLEGEWFFDD